MPTLADSLRAAPTTRAYRADPFPLDLVERALELAGAAGGPEPWRAIAVTDAATRAAIRDAHLPHWREHLRTTGGLRVLADDAPANVARLLRRADMLAERLADVPVHLVIVGPRRAGTAAAAMARALPHRLADEGLAATPLTAGTAMQDELREILALPDDVAVAALLAVGHRAGDLGAPRNRLVHHFADRERWGASW